MHKHKKRTINAVKHPLPEHQINESIQHGKGHYDLVNDDDIPIEVLEKEIPASEFHDM